MANSSEDRLFYLVCGLFLLMNGLRYVWEIYFRRKRSLVYSGRHVQMVGWFLWGSSCMFKSWEISHGIVTRGISDVLGLLGSMLALMGMVCYLRDYYKHRKGPHASTPFRVVSVRLQGHARTHEEDI